MPRTTKQECFVILTCVFEREGDLWTGICRELGVSAYDPDLCKVETELRDLVTEHLNVLESMGERERFFAKHGIRMYKRREPMPAKRRLSVPLGSLVSSIKMPVHCRV